MSETYKVAEYEDMVDHEKRINSIPVHTTKNLFNKKAVTLGYYVNKDTGGLLAHASYCVSDWIPIEAGVTYIDNISSHYAFYTSEKTYISGDATYTKVAPANAAYIRISVQIANLDIAQLEVGTTNTSYVPYLQYHLNDIREFSATNFTVKTSGGDYTSIQDAIDASIGYDNAHAKIYIYPGTYNEEIIGKDFVDIIGIDRDTCILTATGDPLNPVIHDTIKSTHTMDIKNLTILGTNGSKYCVHMDAYGAYTARFINCVLIKEGTVAFGLGLHASQNLELINCVITGEDIAVYCHNWDNQASNCSLTIHNCKLTGNIRSGLYLSSLGSKNTDLLILTNNKILGYEASMIINRDTNYGENQDDFQIIASGNQIDTVKRINGALTSFSQPIVSETVFTDE